MFIEYYQVDCACNARVRITLRAFFKAMQKGAVMSTYRSLLLDFEPYPFPYASSGGTDAIEIRQS